MNEEERQFLLCIDAAGNDDLEVRKIYEVLPDPKASEENYVRVIDESGEDYLYPTELFCPIEIAASIRERLPRAA